MDAFTMEIAGISFLVHPMFQSTREYCRPYLTDKEPQFCIWVTADDLLHEQNLLEREAVAQGLKIRKFKEPFLERSTIQRRVSDRLISHNALALHGSTVAVDGYAYLFTAPCGTGKSTHTRLWRELFGNRAVMVNDDKPFLHISPSGVIAFGSPWNGKHGLGSNVSVPLKGISLLNRGCQNRICPLDPEQGIVLLQEQIHMPEDGFLQDRAKALLIELCGQIPLWEMSCNKDLQAAMVSYTAMSNTAI